MDPLYIPNGTVQYSCRNGSNGSNTLYSIFGKYGCDSPITLLQSALESMKEKEPNPAFILIGGDLTLHTPPDGNIILNSTGVVIKTLISYFPETPFIITIGNNDVFPHFSANTPIGPWLSKLAPIWSSVFMDSQSLSDFTNFGYYHVMLSNNLEIISLNTVIFSPYYMPYPSPESRQQQHFDWLMEKLIEIKSRGHVVYILGHLPPASVQYNSEIEWHKEYIASFFDIVTKFEDIVIGNFFSHTHRDELKVYSNSSVPIGIMCAGSLSPNTLTNPRFRIFFSNSTSSKLIDYVDYYTDLINSYNSKKDLTWNLEYDFDEAYNEGRVDGQSLLDVLHQLQNDPTLFATWMARYLGLFNLDKARFLCAMEYPVREDFEYCISQIVPIGK